MAPTPRFIALALFSGAVWGGVAYALGSATFGPVIWGGVIASPVIGLIVGLAFRRIRRLGFGKRAFMSLVSLYCAATLFGLAVGLFDLARDVPDRVASEVVTQAVLAVLWGVTLTGYLLILWPLSYLNFILLGRAGEE